jgi:predicted kinase
MEKPILTMLVGVPGSGKSYFARNLAEQTGAVRLNGDAMKRAMFGSYADPNADGMTREANAMAYRGLDYAAESILSAGKSVIYDLNSNRLDTREKHRTLARRLGAISVVVWMRTPPEIAMQRAIEREEQVDQFKFNEERWQRAVAIQARHFDEPTKAEKLIKIHGELPFEDQFTIFSRKTEKIMRKANS